MDFSQDEAYFRRIAGAIAEKIADILAKKALIYFNLSFLNNFNE